MFLPTEESRLQRVVDHSNGIVVPFVPKRFSFLVKNIPVRGRAEEQGDVVMLDESVQELAEAAMEVEKKPLSKIEKQALMMNRNQFKRKAKADLKVKNRKRTQTRDFI